MKSSHLLSACLIALSCLPALGETDRPLPIVDDSVKLVELPGQPTQLVFGDGRVATLMVSKTISKTAQAPLQVTENSCASQTRAPICTYNVNLEILSANLLWTKHPDSKKLGTPLTVVYDENSKYEITPERINYTNFTRFALPAIPNKTPADTITCDHFNWLPQGQDKDLIKMKVWSGEIMAPNNETGVSENQTIISYADLTWARTENTLTLKGVKRTASIILLPPLTSTSLMLIENKKEECQISIGSDLASLTRALDTPAQPLTEIAPSYIRLKNLFLASQVLEYPLKFNKGSIIQ